MKYIDPEKLIAEIEKYENTAIDAYNPRGEDADFWNGKVVACEDLKTFITSLQQEQSEEQPEYGYLSTEYVHGKKSKWNVGDVLAYYICTSNEEGEYPLGKIINVKSDEEDGWVYTFEDGSVWDEQSLFEEEAYKKN